MNITKYSEVKTTGLKKNNNFCFIIVLQYYIQTYNVIITYNQQFVH